MRAMIVMLAAMLLSGCAAWVQTLASSGDLLIDKEARRNLLVSVQGSERAEDNARWQLLRFAWQSHLDREAYDSLYSITHVGERRTLARPGVMVTVDIPNFRYLGQLRRNFLGLMTGNAWVDAKVAYYDLQSGVLLGDRTFRTSSVAGGTFFSHMTERQVAALSARIIDEIRQAEEPPHMAARP